MTRGGSSVAAGVAALVLSVVGSAPVEAQTDGDERISAGRVVFEPIGASAVDIGGRIYRGVVTVDAHSGGLSLVEETDVDSYLLGIREVPFAWEPETLAAQAVAARTYLAWTLDRGRSTNGRRYGYDICATTACQVYAGVGGLTGPDGRRWVDAVASTSGELLVLDGRPIQALYSSTSDGRTRNVEDVFPGSAPQPYLRAVESVGETSPFVEWEFTLDRAQTVSLLDHAGLLDGGRLIRITSDRPGDGEGPWTVTIETTEGATTIDTWTLRTLLNRAARDVLPDLLPALRPDSDRRFPQTIMSPNYGLTSEVTPVTLPDGRQRLEQIVRVAGGGWGHLVGMSQYGAQAMATAGADHTEILGHYYGGIEPTVVDLLPDTIRVGLDTDATEMLVVPTGPVRVTVDGREVTAGDLGSWAVTSDGGLALIDPPVGLGLPPEISGWRAFFDARGAVELVTFRSRTAAEIRIVVRERGVVVSDSGVEVREAGTIAVDLDPRSIRSAVTVQVIATSPNGGDVATFRILGGAE